MKKIFFALTIVSAALFASCRKDAQTPSGYWPQSTSLFVAANFQGINWVAAVSTTYNSTTDTLTINGFYYPNNQYLVIKMPFGGVGVYKPTHQTEGYFYSLDKNNNVTSFYKLDTTQTSNSIHITSFDPSIDIAEGDFQLSFVKTSGAASAPNAANFANGKLWIQVPIKH